MSDSEVRDLLIEIRDTQRQYLEAYQRIAGEALLLQRQATERTAAAMEQQAIAVKTQLEHTKLYRRVIVVAAVLVLVILYWMFTLLR